ncbi:glycosyl transferase family 1, partial [filamentous cyanobacterium CCP5]
MISATFPYPPTRGGTPVRTFNLLQQLSHRHRVTLVTQRDAQVSDREVEDLHQQVDKLVVFPRPTAAQLRPGLPGKSARFLDFVWRGTPPSVNYVHSPEMQAWIDQWLDQQPVDALTCEHSVNERFVRPSYRRRVPKRVVNIHSSLYGTVVNQLQTGTAEHPLRDLVNVPLLRRYERRFARKFSDLVVTTPEDLRFFTPLRRRAPIHVVPNGVNLAQFPLRSHDPGGHHL